MIYEYIRPEARESGVKGFRIKRCWIVDDNSNIL